MSQVTEQQNLEGTALILEDDGNIRGILETMLRQAGFERVESYADVATALGALQRSHFSCIVSDWLLPGGGGALVLDGVRRSESHRFTPFLVVSGYVTPNDFQLMEGLPFTTTIGKPFSSDQVMLQLNLLKQEKEWFTQHKFRLELILRKASSQDPSCTVEFLDILKSAPRPVPIALHVVRNLRQLDQYQAADTILQHVEEQEPGCVLVIMERVKLAVQVKDIDKAAKLYAKVKGRIPDCLERILLLNAPGTDGSGAENGHLRLVRDGDVDGADFPRTASHPLASILSSFAGLINAQGILFSRIGKTEQAAGLYRSLEIPIYANNFRARIALNTALGFLRQVNLIRASEWAQRALQLSNGLLKEAQYIIELVEQQLCHEGKVASPVELDAMERSDLDLENLIARSETASHEFLLRQIPELSIIFDHSRTQGHFVGPLVERLSSYASLDTDLLRMAVHRAIEDDKPTVEHVLFLLEFRRLYA